MGFFFRARVGNLQDGVHFSLARPTPCFNHGNFLTPLCAYLAKDIFHHFKPSFYSKQFLLSLLIQGKSTSLLVHRANFDLHHGVSANIWVHEPRFTLYGEGGVPLISYTQPPSFQSFTLCEQFRLVSVKFKENSRSLTSPKQSCPHARTHGRTLHPWRAHFILLQRFQDLFKGIGQGCTSCLIVKLRLSVGWRGRYTTRLRGFLKSQNTTSVLR